MPMPKFQVAAPKLEAPKLQAPKAPQMQMPAIKMEAPKIAPPQVKPPTNILLIVIWCLVAFLLGAVVMVLVIKPK
jgi:hypothetical protein